MGLILKILPTKIKTYAAMSSLNLGYSPHCCTHICSTRNLLHWKFVPPTPNLLRPLIFRRQAHVSTLYQYKTKTHKSRFFLRTQINILFRYCPHPLRSLILYIHSAPLAHSPHPLHPLIHGIRQRRKNAQETVSISASPTTVPVFRIKFYIMLHIKKDKYVYNIMVCFKLPCTYKENLL